MKKITILALVMAAMMITGCSNSDSSSKERTTTTTKEAAAEESSSEQETVTTTTTAADESSEAEEVTTTQTTESKKETDSSKSEDDSSGQEQGDDIKLADNKVTSKSFGIDISYPDGWAIKEYEPDMDNTTQTIARVSNEDLGVSTMVNVMDFTSKLEEGRTVSAQEITENLKSALTEASSDPEDPMNAKDITSEEGQIGNATTMLLSFVQRNAKLYTYTFVYKDSEVENRFLVFSYAYSDSDNADNIKTAIEEMMS